MHEPGQLTVEDCWHDGGRLRLEVHEGGARVRMAGNAEGFVGLARILLFLAHNGLEDGAVVALDRLDAFEPGEPVLEISDPAR